MAHQNKTVEPAPEKREGQLQSTEQVLPPKVQELMRQQEKDERLVQTDTRGKLAKLSALLPVSPEQKMERFRA